MTEQRIRNINKLLLSEVLRMLNEDPSLMQPGKPFAFQQNSALHKVFYYGYVPSARFLLPEGIPPFTPSNMRPGANATDLLVAIRRGRFSYMVDKNIPNARREQLFIGLLETVYQEEAKILLAIKDQNLDELFPNLTYKTLYEVGYLPYDEERCGDKQATASKSEETNEEVAKPRKQPARRHSSTKKATTKAQQ